ncbi:hypothetical protein [Kitasatospora azatica]|uniref:hypothetical protein n=1 Tax=Kitasatospora azatica TaxID=58347 RepID=UPI000569DCD7|nr:hypothetical protein [Kitasatospora azatica]
MSTVPPAVRAAIEHRIDQAHAAGFDAVMAELDALETEFGPETMRRVCSEPDPDNTPRSTDH